jgi:ABC-type multidrug transport system fused ATPase/permease subunit
MTLPSDFKSGLAPQLLAPAPTVAETDGFVSQAISSDALARARPFRWSDSITLREISFRYPGASRPALNGIFLIIARNTSLGVIGPTGSGKSTFVDLLLGLYQPTAGEILIEDEPLTPALVPAWQASIGYVPQDIFLIDDTIARNIAFGLPDTEIDPARLREASLRHGAAARIHRNRIACRL